MTFLDRLGKAMQMDEISQEIGIDLHTESLLVRAEQLARLETDKLVDKVRKREREKGREREKATIDITFFRCRCHVANVSFILCFFVANRVLTTRSTCAAATRPYRGFGASDRSTSFPVSKK